MRNLITFTMFAVAFLASPAERNISLIPLDDNPTQEPQTIPKLPELPELQFPLFPLPPTTQPAPGVPGTPFAPFEESLLRLELEILNTKIEVQLLRNLVFQLLQRQHPKKPKRRA